MQYIIKKQTPKILNNYKLDFLNDFKEYINIDYIYNAINSLNEYEIINIYNFIKIRTIILDKLISYDFQSLENISDIKSDLFNEKIKSFINNNIVLAIFVSNSILLYI